MPFFFSKKPASVAQDLSLAGGECNRAESFEVELLTTGAQAIAGFLMTTRWRS